MQLPAMGIWCVILFAFVVLPCQAGAEPLQFSTAHALSPYTSKKMVPTLRASQHRGSWTKQGCVAPPLRLSGGGNTLGVDGEAITEEQAGEELIKATTQNNIEGLDPAGINLLVQSGAPVNYQDMWKRTPLHYAARDGHLLAAKRLVELGGDLTAQDFLGRTPLHMAARKGHADAVVLLSQLGSDLNHPDNNPWPNNKGRTPMHWACYKGHAEVVHQLCELGANKEAVDAMKRTPLHWAARRGHSACVQVLLVMGASVHAVDAKSMKPINLANSKESNHKTQQLLHAATIRRVLPAGLPLFDSPPRPSMPAIAPARQGGPQQLSEDSDEEGGAGAALSLQQAVAKAKGRLQPPRAPPQQYAEDEEEEEEEEAVVDGVYDDEEEDGGVYEEDEDEDEDDGGAAEEEEEYVEEEDEEEAVEDNQEEEDEDDEEVVGEEDEEEEEEEEEAGGGATGPAQDPAFAEALAKAKALYEQQQGELDAEPSGKAVKPAGAPDDGIRFVREQNAAWGQDEEDEDDDDEDDVEFA